MGVTSISSTPADQAAQLIGQRLARYRVEELIGRGGMAWVYRAWDENLERPVAIKVLTPQALGADQSLERFHREALAVARLDHPHVIHLYDCGEVAGRPYMVMQYIPGPNLADRLRDQNQRGEFLPRDEVLTILRQVAEALDYAHAQGLIHRDVKPSNVLFKDPDHAVLTDFGVARLHKDLKGLHPTLTDADQVLGTPTYMAPEQATRTIPTSAASDIYSLAVVAYEMLSGQPPFEADSTLSAILKHILEPPPAIRDRRPDLPLAVEPVFQRALDKDPARRFPTAAAFAAALAAAWPEPTSPAVPPAPAPPVEPPPAPAPPVEPPPADHPTPPPPASLPATPPRPTSGRGLRSVFALAGRIGAAMAAVVLGALLLWWAAANGLWNAAFGPGSPSPTVTSRPPTAQATPTVTAMPGTPRPTPPPATMTSTPAISSTPSPSATATTSLSYRAVYLGVRTAGSTVIRGQITDRAGKPQTDVLVELYDPDWKWLRTVGTNYEGRYEFVISPDSYYLRLKNRPGAPSPRITVKFSQEATVNWVEEAQ